ncbi:MAG: hypothetical protein WC444_05155 [Candidatus Paceibacterota bacterium]
MIVKWYAMAFADIENKECLCAWLAGLGEPPKQQLKTLIQVANGLIQTAKAVYILINTDFEDLLKKEALEKLLEVYKLATKPLEMPLNYLSAVTAPAADCPPVAQIAATMYDLKNTLLAPVKDLEEEIEAYISSIEQSQANSEFLDMLSSVLDDISQAINEC